MRLSKDRPIVATSSRVAYENHWLRIREDKIRRANGEGIYGVVETSDSVAVCAVNDFHEVYLVYGYSYPTDTWSWQIPGGDADGEKPETAAARELEEETGLTGKTYELIGNPIVSCGLFTERMAVVVAQNLHLGSRPVSADDLDSITDGKFVSLATAESMVETGDICDSQTLSAIYLLEKWMKRSGN